VGKSKVIEMLMIIQLGLVGEGLGAVPIRIQGPSKILEIGESLWKVRIISMIRYVNMVLSSTLFVCSNVPSYFSLPSPLSPPFSAVERSVGVKCHFTLPCHEQSRGSHRHPR
jgi:hypothetical protein